MKQKGNFAKASTPIEPLSMDSLVRIMAVIAVNIMSNIPKQFQIKVIVLAFFCFSRMAFTTKILVIAVIISPEPAMTAKIFGKASW